MIHKVRGPYLLSIILLQVVVFFLSAVNAFYYFTGIRLPDPLKTIEGVNLNQIFVGEYVLIRSIYSLPIMLYGLFLVLYPQRGRLENKMRLFGGGIFIFGISFPYFAYLEIIAVKNENYDLLYYYSSLQGPTMLGILVVVLIFLYILPSSTDAEKQHRKLLFLSVVGVILTLTVLPFVYGYIILLFFNPTPFEALFFILILYGTISYLFLSVFFILVVQSTLVVFRQLNQEEDNEVLYPNAIAV